MTTMLLVAGAVIGLIIGLHFLRKMRQTEKKVDLHGIMLECPSCKILFDAEKCWVRDGLRGSFFYCSGCARTSIWDMKRLPPKLKSWQK